MESEHIRNTHVLWLHESVAHSWASDFGSFATVVGMWSLGFFVGSTALEWAGAFLGMMMVVAKAMSFRDKQIKTRMTPSEAREWLDREFPEHEQKMSDD